MTSPNASVSALCSAIVYAVAWNCLPERGGKDACEICCDDRTEQEGQPLYRGREADRELLVKVVCEEGKEDVTRPRAALGLAADDGAANAELLAERSIIVIVGSPGKTIKEVP